MKLLVTGSAGLIGSEAVKFYCDQGHDVVGIDNNFRKKFFSNACTMWNRHQLEEAYPKLYKH